MRATTEFMRPDRVETDGAVTIPRDIFSKRDVTLNADVMFLNGHAFLTALSRQVRLVTGITSRAIRHLTYIEH